MGIKNDKGLSLVELMIVIAIMAILASVVAPAFLKYVDRSRKANDVATAEVIYDAACLAFTTSNDDAYNGWSSCYDMYPNNNYGGSIIATSDGKRKNSQLSSVRLSQQDKNDGCYIIRPVAWCRGIKYKNWENTWFKSTLDGQPGAEEQRDYTNVFLECLAQEAATGGHTSNRNYDGETSVNMKLKYTKKVENYKGEKFTPECWILYRRDDTGYPEVWVGYKSGAVQPLYRLYPDPSAEYYD